MTFSYLYQQLQPTHHTCTPYWPRSFVLVSGSLLLESYFGIPGIGLVTFNAITSGDQPVLKAVVGLTGVLFVLVMTINDMLYSVVDPRVAKP